MKTLVCLFFVVALALAKPSLRSGHHYHGSGYTSSEEAYDARDYTNHIFRGNLRNAFVDSLPDYLKNSVLEVERQMPVYRQNPGILPAGDVRFFLYTQQKPTPTEIVAGNTHLVDKSKPLKFILHGWLQNSKTQWVVAMKDQFLTVGDYNVILIDWETPAWNVYEKSAGYTDKIGSFLADFFYTAGFPLDKLHLIGHDLGAQIAGYTGKFIYKKTVNVKVNRISALDPAGPGFQESRYDPADKLQKTDADFVDVTHSDSLVFGFFDSIGHVDFFPNGGERNQPGCFNSNVKEDGINCSHTRAVYFYIESIVSDKFVGTQCGSWSDYLKFSCTSNPKVRYGYAVPPSTTGNFYYKTNAQSPYAQG